MTLSRIRIRDRYGSADVRTDVIGGDHNLTPKLAHGSGSVTLAGPTGRMPIDKLRGRPIKRTLLNNESGGVPSTLVAAIPGRKIRVISGLIVSPDIPGPLDFIYFLNDSGVPLIITQKVFLLQYVPLELTRNVDGHFETTVGHALEVDARVEIYGWLNYVEV